MLSNRFRIFQSPINLNKEKVKKIVKACCVLHNFLIEKSDWFIDSTANQIIQQDERTQFSPTLNASHDRSGNDARNIRNNFSE